MSFVGANSGGTAPAESVRYRRARSDDAMACHELMWASVTDLGQRQGSPLAGTADEWWRSSEALYQEVARMAAEWWVAEESGSGRPIGFARSIERDGLLELTELFVLPGRQSRGVGRALLDRAFPTGRGTVRSIIATTDVRAQARYYAAGTVARFPLYTLSGAVSGRSVASGDLVAEPVEGQRALEAQREVERAVLGHRRSEAELGWLLRQRRGHLYRRADAVVGFSFVGADGTGPAAVLDPDDLPAVLAHVEGVAGSIGLEHVEFQVPGPNATAIRYLTGRGYRFDPWINLLMSDRPFGRFDRFIPFSPPLFL